MATPLTPAHLPPHVIKAVIGYVIEAPDDFEDLIAEYVTDSAFKPLLHVCCSWREVAMPMMFAGCNASISDHVSFTYRPVGSNPCIIQQVDSHYNQHVRYMFLKLDYASIATGAALRLLRSTYAHLRFPNVHVVDVELDLGAISNINDDMALCHTRRFLSYLCVALPNVSSTSATIVSTTLDSHVIHGAALSALILHFTRASHIVELKTHETSCPSIIDSCLPVTNLTALRCRWDANHTTTARLIHASTQTLLHLSICLHTAAGLELLVFNSHRQEPVVFPYLTKLLLSQRPDVSIKPLLPIDQVAPFPRLQRLQLSVKYPFSDDLPFRGNASTLEFLCMKLDPHTLHLLSTHGAFGPGCLPALQHLVIGNSLQGGEHTESMDAEYHKFFTWVLPTTSYVFVHSPDDARLLLHTLPLKAEHQNMQLLSLLHTHLSFSQVVCILASFSQLRILICKYSNMGDDFNTMSIQQAATVLRQTYSPLNTNLQSLHIYDFEANSVNMMAASVLLLADQCPHLTMVKFPKDREDCALNVLLRLNHSRYPAEFCKLFLATLDFSLNQTSKYTIIKIKHKLLVS
ncbi:hypothetical protein H4S01_003947 [Coemansia sp. RSA 2610]|nr:hypothetical protein H4S01_003947 [Coemansia sp. RSA 2610]